MILYGAETDVNTGQMCLLLFYTLFLKMNKNNNSLRMNEHVYVKIEH